MLRKTLSEWPQKVSPQVLRSCLGAFKDELCDANFVEEICASCCRLKRRSKLRTVIFPASSSCEAPSWLPWSPEDWLRYREAWFAGVDNILNVDRYLERFFDVDGKVIEARKELLAFEENNDLSTSFASVAAAESWQRRVDHWRENLRRDITADSVAAPGQSWSRWLLYSSSSLTIDSATGTITCQLCKHCCNSFANVEGASGKPKVCMPEMARANGMWRGPDPEVLSCLSYCENKVMNLARLYVSVKRVFLDRRFYKPGAPTLYHQNNVVAFPQNPDGIVKILGTNPKNLAQCLHVQFVGECRSELRNHPDLQVSVYRLREAFRWLCQNSWAYMEATKHHEFWEKDELDPVLENILAEYEQSVGGTSGGVPEEIVQGASRIAAERVNVHVSGPANCTQGEEADDNAVEKDRNVAGGEDEPASENCAGVLDGGVDSVSPIQIWNNIMKAYKVAQVCGKEIERLEKSDKLSEKESFRRDQAQAISEAVHLLASLHSREVKAKLADYLNAEKHEDCNLSYKHTVRY